MYIKSTGKNFSSASPSLLWQETDIHVIKRVKRKCSVKKIIDSYINTVKPHKLFFEMKFTTSYIL